MDTKNQESVKSFNLYTAIADTLDDLGVKFTMVCGKEKGAPLDNLHAINKSVTMWNDAFGKTFIGDSKKLSQNQVVEILENHYQFVETNAGDKINLVVEPSSNIQSLVG